MVSQAERLRRQQRELLRGVPETSSKDLQLQQRALTAGINPERLRQRERAIQQASNSPEVKSVQGSIEKQRSVERFLLGQKKIFERQVREKEQALSRSGLDNETRRGLRETRNVAEAELRAINESLSAVRGNLSQLSQLKTQAQRAVASGDRETAREISQVAKDAIIRKETVGGFIAQVRGGEARTQLFQERQSRFFDRPMRVSLSEQIPGQRLPGVRVKDFEGGGAKVEFFEFDTGRVVRERFDIPAQKFDEFKKEFDLSLSIGERGESIQFPKKQTRTDLAPEFRQPSILDTIQPQDTRGTIIKKRERVESDLFKRPLFEERGEISFLIPAERKSLRETRTDLAPEFNIIFGNSEIPEAPKREVTEAKGFRIFDKNAPFNIQVLQTLGAVPEFAGEKILEPNIRFPNLSLGFQELNGKRETRTDLAPNIFGNGNVNNLSSTIKEIDLTIKNPLADVIGEGSLLRKRVPGVSREELGGVIAGSVFAPAFNTGASAIQTTKRKKSIEELFKEFGEALEQEKTGITVAGQATETRETARKLVRNVLEQNDKKNIEKLRNFFKRRGQEDLFDDLVAQEQAVISTGNIVNEVNFDIPRTIEGAGTTTGLPTIVGGKGAKSEFQGKGMFEKTNDISLEKTRNIFNSQDLGLSKTDSKINQKLFSGSLFKFDTKQSQDTKNKLKQLTGVSSALANLSGLAQPSASGQIPKQTPSLRDLTRTTIDLTSKSGQGGRGTPKPRTPRKPKKPILPLIPKFDKEIDLTGTGKGKGYNVFVKDKGKFIKTNKNPLTRIDALSQGSYLTDNTTARTFKISKTNKMAKPMKRSIPPAYWVGNQRKFRQFRVKRGRKARLQQNTFIEKRPFGIDTPGEQKGLKLGRFLKRLSGNRRANINLNKLL